MDEDKQSMMLRKAENTDALQHKQVSNRSATAKLWDCTQSDLMPSSVKTGHMAQK
jgi:hypothetical protein